MSKNNYFGEGIIFTISDYLLDFMVSSFFFWILNLPLLFYFIFTTIYPSYSSSLVFFIVSLLIYPAFTALLSTMGKLIKNGTVNVLKEFFISYKTNFFTSILIGLIQNIMLEFFYLNNLYVTSINDMQFFHYLFLFLALLCFSINFYFFPIVSRFYARKSDIYKLSVFYLIKRPYIAVISFIILYILYLIAYNLSFLLSLSLISVFAYILIQLQKQTLLKLEKTIKME